MFSLKQSRPITLIAVSIVLSTFSLKAQNGSELFKAHCTACHTVGGGKMVGPDLKGISELRSEEWLLKWIKSSRSMIDSGDPDAVQVFHDNNDIPMPDQNLSDPEVKAVLAYINTQTASGEVTAGANVSSQEPLQSSEDATAEDILVGQHIFEGRTRLANGGPSCISCHNVATNRIIPGGLLAKDLTTVFSRMGGDAGLTGILNAPPFPAMTEAYKNKPMTKDEIYALTSFLNTVDKESTTQTATAKSPLLLYGFISFAVWIVIIFMVWFHRKKYAVNKRIYERQLKTS